MRTWLLVGLVAGLILLPGCGTLLPKKVEYFQDKVQKMPEASDKNIELQKQTAYMAKDKAKETLVAAIKENASTNVVTPAVDTAVLTDSLSGSLGKPVAPFTGQATNLVLKLNKEDAKLDAKLDEFKHQNDENAGKKIEGTGTFQLSYLTNLLVLGIIAMVLYAALKIVTLISGGSPVVSVGTQIMEGSVKAVTKLAHKGFGELIEGGEQFKKLVEEKFDDPATQEKIKELFRNAHESKQSRDVQDVVKNLTAK